MSIAVSESGKASLLPYLPHRGRSLLIDEFIAADDDRVSVSLTISADIPFFDPSLSGVPAWVGIEYMAQTVSVWSGKQQVLRGQDVTIGFLLGSRRYRSEVPVFEQGLKLLVDCQVCYVDDTGLSSFDCKITDASSSKLLAQARINAFRPNQREQYAQVINNINKSK